MAEVGRQMMLPSQDLMLSPAPKADVTTSTPATERTERELRDLVQNESALQVPAVAEPVASSGPAGGLLPAVRLHHQQEAQRAEQLQRQQLLRLQQQLPQPQQEMLQPQQELPAQLQRTLPSALSPQQPQQPQQQSQQQQQQQKLQQLHLRQLMQPRAGQQPNDGPRRTRGASLHGSGALAATEAASPSVGGGGMAAATAAAGGTPRTASPGGLAGPVGSRGPEPSLDHNRTQPFGDTTIWHHQESRLSATLGRPPPPLGATAQELGPRPASSTQLLNATGQQPLTSTSNVLNEMWRESRVARQQLEAKRGDLVTAMQALHETDTALREVLNERQAKHSEIRLLQQKVADLEGDVKAESMQAEEAEAQRLEAEERCRASEQGRQRTEALVEELRGQLKAAEEQRALADTQRAEAQQAAVAGARAAAQREEALQRMCEEQVQARLQVETSLREAQASWAQRSASQQAELRKVAMKELQALSVEQQALRSELRRAMKPPPAMPSFSTSLLGAGNYGLPPYRDNSRDEGLERMRARVATERGVSAWHSPVYEPGATSGSLLSGKVKKQADYLREQLRNAESRH